MRLKFGDFIVFGAVALLAAASFLLGLGPRIHSVGAAAEIWLDGRLIRVVNLEAVAGPVRYDLGGAYRLVVEAERGRIRFESANCPDKVCVHTGWLTAAGQSAACVPGRAIVKIVGASEQDVVVR